MLRWYLVHTKPGCESIARLNLERQEYEVYFPQLVQPADVRNRGRERVIALFPRYLFVRVDESYQHLSPARGTVGVSSIVRFGDDYAVVPDNVVQELRARADPASGLHRISTDLCLKRGMPVVLTGPPFEGLEAIFEDRAGTDRVVVLLNLLGREARVHVPADRLMPGRTGSDARANRPMWDGVLADAHG
jgi:transcriptional antiterminator RfaH